MKKPKKILILVLYLCCIFCTTAFSMEAVTDSNSQIAEILQTQGQNAAVLGLDGACIAWTAWGECGRPVFRPNSYYCDIHGCPICGGEKVDSDPYCWSCVSQVCPLCGNPCLSGSEYCADHQESTVSAPTITRNPNTSTSKSDVTVTLSGSISSREESIIYSYKVVKDGTAIVEWKSGSSYTATEAGNYVVFGKAQVVTGAESEVVSTSFILDKTPPERAEYHYNAIEGKISEFILAMDSIPAAKSNFNYILTFDPDTFEIDDLYLGTPEKETERYIDLQNGFQFQRTSPQKIKITFTKPPEQALSKVLAGVRFLEKRTNLTVLYFGEEEI